MQILVYTSDFSVFINQLSKIMIKSNSKSLLDHTQVIYRYISNNDDPVKTLFTFCGVYHGNSPDIKGNPPYNF